MKRIALPLIALALAAPQPASAIVGTVTEGTSFAASTVMVLQRQGRLAGFCSGIVVAPDAVLTAAHCVPSGADIRVHYRDGVDPVLLGVTTVERHPDYHADAIRARLRSIDLALLRLATPLPPSFRPAPLGDADSTDVGRQFRLAGFGLTREDDPRSAGTLHSGAVASRLPLSNVLLWAEGAAGRGTGACTGDSGGPVLDERDAVVAVIAWSAGTGTRQCGALTQAVWIGPQRAWIDMVLRRWAE